MERKADVVMLQELPEERGGVGIIHSAYEIRKRKSVWTAVRKRNALAADERTDLSKGANDDVIVIDVKRTGEKMTRMINICKQRDVQTGERQARKINWHKII